MSSSNMIEAPISNETWDGQSLRVWISRKLQQTVFLPATSSWSFTGRQVHGRCSLPQGYALAILSPKANVCNLSNKSNIPDNKPGGGPKDVSRWRDLKHLNNFLLDAFNPFKDASPAPRDYAVHSVGFCSSHSILRGVISIFQLIYASSTLYRTKGDQLDRYGYAAFRLTVTPYLLISFVNLLRSLNT